MHVVVVRPHETGEWEDDFVPKEEGKVRAPSLALVLSNRCPMFRLWSYAVAMPCPGLICMACRYQEWRWPNPKEVTCSRCAAKSNATEPQPQYILYREGGSLSLSSQGVQHMALSSGVCAGQALERKQKIESEVKLGVRIWF